LRSYVFKKIDSFQSTTRSRSTAILFFSLAIYFIAVAKNNDFIYFLNSGVNKFELMMSLKDGKYFLNFLSGGMLYVLLIVVSVYGKTKSSFSWLIVVMVFSYFFLAQPGTRTWALSLALSFFFLAKYPSIYIFGKTSILVLIVGFLSVIGLNVLNLVRLGQDVEVTGLIAKSFLSLYSNFLQYENALILISSFNDTGEWLKFRFLIASLSPFVVVPNILLPFDKPRADKEAFITESLFSSDLDLNFYSEGSTLTYTVPISGYADFGLFGVAVAALIYGLIISFFYYGMKYGRVSRLLALYGLVSFSAGYRLGVEGLMLLMYVFFIVLAVSFVFFKSRIRS
jgi:oligosaccharide repeat unit polymerase